MVPALGDLGRGKREAGPDLFLTQGVRLAQVLRSLAGGQGPEDHIHWHTGAPNDRLPAPHGRVRCTFVVADYGNAARRGNIWNQDLAGSIENIPHLAGIAETPPGQGEECGAQSSSCPRR